MKAFFISHSGFLGVLFLGVASSASAQGTAPAVFVHPVNVSTSLGQPATFTIAAAGSPAPTYQWRRNGTPIPGATASTFRIPAVALGDALGAYTVTVSNVHGSATSNAATLAINGQLLAITSPPPNVTVNPGLLAVLSATVVANPAATYQWHRNGVAIAGATATTLTIPGVTSANAGSYVLVATNALGTLVSIPGILTVPPIIIAPPVATGVNAGTGTARLEVSSPDATGFQWQKNGTNITNGGPFSGATTSTLTVTNPDYSAAGTYTVVVSNSGGSTTTDPVGLTVFPVRVPTIATQPQSVTTSAGSAVSFRVVPELTGAPGFTYQWRRNGVPLANSNSDTYTIASVSAADVGTYTVVITNNPPDPSTPVTSAPATLALAAGPVITTQPNSATRTERESVTFSVVAAGTPAPTYQWLKGTTAIPGATNSVFTIPSVALGDAGTYAVDVTNSAGTTRSSSATLVVNPAAVVPSARGRLSNLSVLTSVNAADPSFIVGTVIGGAGTSGAKAVLVRAGGPSLLPLGVDDALPDPQLTLVQGALTQTNDDWGGTSALQAAFTRLGAFGYVSPGSKDAALLLPALASGDCTVQVSRVGNAAGSVIAEIYDATPTDAMGEGVPRLINVSVRKVVPAGTSLTAGFVIAGGARTVLVRAVGPTLAGFNVSGVMEDPQMTFFRQGTAAGGNNDWGGGGTLAAVFGQVGAFALPSSSRDSALVATLDPGDYTVVVSGVGGTGGAVLVEVYEVP